jgi:uncharacterized membrane protein
MEFIANLHPAVIHFPIVLFVVYCVLEIVSLFYRKELLFNSATILLGAGIFFSVLAVLTGNQEHELLKSALKNKMPAVRDIINYHEQYATITLWYFISLFALRGYLIIKKKISTYPKIIFALLALIGIYFVYQTGKFGGSLVFDFGVGTQLFNK